MTNYPEVAIDSEQYAGVVAWVNREAELLDTGREREWLETMVSKEIVYQLPLRQTVERARGTGFSKATFHLDESYGSLLTRVSRNESAYAWAEDPPVPYPALCHQYSSLRTRERTGRSQKQPADLSNPGRSNSTATLLGRAAGRSPNRRRQSETLPAHYPVGSNRYRDSQSGYFFLNSEERQ